MNDVIKRFSEELISNYNDKINKIIQYNELITKGSPFIKNISREGVTLGDKKKKMMKYLS